MNLVSDLIPKQTHEDKQAVMQAAMQHLLSKGMLFFILYPLPPPQQTPSFPRCIAQLLFHSAS